jgi:outer membrane protein assembly factor BamB
MDRQRFGSPLFVAAIGVWLITALALVRAADEKERTAPFVRWAVTEDFVSNDPYDPLVVKGKVIVGTDQGELRAYRCETGELAWTFAQGKRIYYRPSSDGTYVYCTSAAGLTAVEVADGTKAWTLDGAFRGGPTIVLGKQGLVCVAGSDGNLYAVDAKTGDERWRCDFVSDAPPDPPGLPAGVQNRLRGMRARPTAMVNDAETLFLSVMDQCRVVALNATTGKQRWSFQTGKWLQGAAVATDKHVFFGSQDKIFYCLDKKTGKKAWSFETKGVIESGGAVDDKYVYFGSCDGSLYCLNQADGKERWKFATDGAGGNNHIYSVPLLRGDAVYFAAGEGQAYALDGNSGKLKWKSRPSEGSELYCSPASDGALLFFVTRARHKGPGEPSLVAIGQK